MTDRDKPAEKFRKRNVALAKDRSRQEQEDLITQAAIKAGSGWPADIIKLIPEIIEEQLRIEQGRQPTTQEVKRHYRGERQYKRYISDLVKRGDLTRDRFDVIRPSDKLLQRQEIRRLFAKYLGHSLAFTVYPVVVKKVKKKEKEKGKKDLEEEEISIAFAGKRKREETMRQLVERIGLYALYVYMKAVEPVANMYKPAPQYNEEMRAFVKDTFDVLEPFSIFMINTLPAPSGEPEIDRQRYRVMDRDDYDSLERLLIGMYGERFKKLQNRERMFYRKFPVFADLKKKEEERA